MKYHQTNISSRLLVALLFLIALPLSAQHTLTWNTWEEGMKKSARTHKPVLVTIYNNGCSWCKHMDKTTFSDPDIKAYINDHFIPIALNMEESESLEFKSKDYELIKKGNRSYHELAIDLTGGRYGTPAVIFLAQNGEVLQSLIGYKDADKFKNILTYFGESHYKKIPWHKYLEYANRE